MARSVAPLRLSALQRKELVALSKSPRERLARRASVILAVAEEGMTYTSVAQRLGTGVARVRRWRKRFEQEGCKALEDLERSGGPKAELVVSDQQRTELNRLAGRARTNGSVAFRAKIVLACAEGMTNLGVATRMHTTPGTVGRWRKRFVDKGVDGLLDEPRPGAPRTITDEDVEAVLVKTLESKPKGRTHWSMRKMATEAGMSHTTVGRIWRTFGLQPHVVTCRDASRLAGVWLGKSARVGVS